MKLVGESHQYCNAYCTISDVVLNTIILGLLYTTVVLKVDIVYIFTCCYVTVCIYQMLAEGGSFEVSTDPQKRSIYSDLMNYSEVSGGEMELYPGHAISQSRSELFTTNMLCTI
jgi:hypothetical protein